MSIKENIERERAYLRGFQDGLKATQVKRYRDVPVSPFTKKREKAKKPRSKKQKANDKRIGRLMKQGYSMKEAHRVNSGGY